MSLQQCFSDFNDQIKIDSEAQMLMEKRQKLEIDIKDHLPRILKENHDIEINKTDINFVDQGSYKYHTTIVSSSLDRDVALKLPLSKDKITAMALKQCVEASLTTRPNRTVIIKDPCITVKYCQDGEEMFHIDLPVYTKDDSDGRYLARGKNRSVDGEWESSDPDGLNDDLCQRLNGQDQLRRIIRFVKKWKNEAYKNSIRDHEIPPSIGLTYLACDCFQLQGTLWDEKNDLQALSQVMKYIRDKFSVEKDWNGNILSADIQRFLQMKPYSDIFSKMRDSSKSYMVTFYNRIAKAATYLENALNADTDDAAALQVRKVLGEDFPLPPQNVTKAALGGVFISRRENGFG